MIAITDALFEALANYGTLFELHGNDVLEVVIEQGTDPKGNPEWFPRSWKVTYGQSPEEPPLANGALLTDLLDQSTIDYVRKRDRQAFATPKVEGPGAD